MVVPVTVIIPVYRANKMKFWECLNSLLKQTVSPEKVIIVDDGNTKQEKAKLQEVIKKVTSTRKIELVLLQNDTNEGVSTARNKAISEASTKWITFLDCDDKLSPQFLERLYEATYLYENIDIVACGCIADDGMEYHPNHFFMKEEVFSGENLIEVEKALINQFYRRIGYIDTAFGGPWGKLYSLKTVNGIWFDPLLKRMEDSIWNHQILIERKPKILYIDEMLYIYNTEHIAKYSQEYAEDLSDWTKVINSRKRLVSSHLGTGDQIEEFFFEEVVRILVLMLEKKYFHKENKNKKQTFLELKQLLENKTVNTSLKYVCKRTPFYRQIMLKLLAAGNLKLAYAMYIARNLKK